MPKATIPRDEARQARRHNPLSEEYVSTQPLKQKPRKKRKLQKEEEDGETYVDSKASRKILKIGQDLVEEDRAEQRIPTANPAFALESRFGGADELSDQEGGEYDDEDGWADEQDDEVVEEVVSCQRHGFKIHVLTGVRRS